MPIIEGLGGRLREVRRRRGFSLEELAELARSNRRSLYSYEKGIVDPKVGDLKAIADVLEVSVAYLVGEREEPDAQSHVSSKAHAELRALVFQLVKEALNSK